MITSQVGACTGYFAICNSDCNSQPQRKGILLRARKSPNSAQSWEPLTVKSAKSNSDNAIILT
ncbi:MAG: hypothetical protein AAF915_05495 [Cyanobacteria bacterium P01_D01_bin.50]